MIQVSRQEWEGLNNLPKSIHLSSAQTPNPKPWPGSLQSSGPSYNTILLRGPFCAQAFKYYESCLPSVGVKTVCKEENVSL